ncbi:MAG TPA: hypothetical protein VFF27_18970, partial [Bacteroidia bacterium]|nr:hypothetical protein [Bacteroidia bacterium]
MKRIAMIGVLLCLSTFIFAQTKKMQVSISINVKVDTIKTRVYQAEQADENENIKTVVLKAR